MAKINEILIYLKWIQIHICNFVLLLIAKVMFNQFHSFRTYEENNIKTNILLEQKCIICINWYLATAHSKKLCSFKCTLVETSEASFKYFFWKCIWITNFNMYRVTHFHHWSVTSNFIPCVSPALAFQPWLHFSGFHQPKKCLPCRWPFSFLNRQKLDNEHCATWCQSYKWLHF